LFPQGAIWFSGVPRAAVKREHIVNALQRLRTDRGLSQERLASYAEVDRTTVGKIERGLMVPTLLKIDQLLVAMDVTWTEFGETLDRELNGNGDSPRQSARRR
jgi:transcriptional regulator with XRE-family HTH domain